MQRDNGGRRARLIGNGMNRRILFLVSVVFVALTMGSRSAGLQPRAPAGSIAAASTFAQEVPRQEAAFSLVELWRVGGVNAGPESAFQGPFFVTAIGPEGEAVILDQLASRVSVFEGNTGSFVRAFGRLGDGPGELRGPGGMAWGPGYRLWVADPFDRSYAVFDSVGVFVETVPRPGRSTASRVYPLVIRPDGGVLDHVPASRDIKLFHLDSTGAIRNELVIRRPRVELDGRELALPMPGSELGEAFSAVNGLRPTIRWSFTKDGKSVWVVRSDSMVLVHLAMTGDTLAQVRLHHRSAAFNSAQGQAVDRINRLLGYDAGYAPILVQAIHVLDDGRVLLQIGSSWTESGQEFDVLDPRGRLLGTVKAPFKVHHRSEMASRGDTLLVPAVGEYDVPLLVKALLKRN